MHVHVWDEAALKERLCDVARVKGQTISGKRQEGSTHDEEAKCKE